jgi:hypothetical protein
MRPIAGAAGWLNVKMFEATGDEVKFGQARRVGMRLPSPAVPSTCN